MTRYLFNPANMRMQCQSHSIANTWNRKIWGEMCIWGNANMRIWCIVTPCHWSCSTPEHRWHSWSPDLLLSHIWCSYTSPLKWKTLSGNDLCRKDSTNMSSFGLESVTARCGLHAEMHFRGSWQKQCFQPLSWNNILPVLGSGPKFLPN